MHHFGVVSAVVLATALSATDARAIPAWARKYNMNCSGCHYPAPPQLNAHGIRFRWAGYRMADDSELGRGVSVDQVSNYISAQGRVVFSLAKTGNQTASSAMDASQAAIWYSGPFGKNFFAWFEFDRTPQATVDLMAQIGGVWGSERSFGGFKVGQGHALFEVGVAGFDRNVALTDAPLPLEEPGTAGVPFVFAMDRVGAEVFYVRGNNRVSLQAMEPWAGFGTTANNHKDFVFTDQLLLDRKGSGLQFTALYGSILGVDTSAVGLRSNYWRLAASASHYIGSFQLLGGVAYGQDNDLPVGGTSPFPTSSIKGLGYWVSGQYLVPRTPLALYARYEFADPNKSVSSDGSTRVVLGGVLPLTLPEYLRLNVEYSLRTSQVAGASNMHTLATGLTLTF